MQKRILLAVITALSFLVLSHQPTCAQSDPPKLELGAQFSVIRLTDLDTTEPGVGGRVTYNLNRHLSVEGEFNFFPREKTFFSGGQKIEGLFGAKYGWRSDKFGVFGKLRPGLMHFDALTVGCPPGLLCAAIVALPSERTSFALDVGGVFEYYPSRHTAVRFDLGDTIIRYHEFSPAFTNHNLQFSTGVGFRF